MKLITIQNELKAPKDLNNSFGGYRYRSCESILEALKPLLFANKCSLMISDEIVEVGGRIYVKATAHLADCEDKSNSWSVSAFAREAEMKKGMDLAQVTGAASSYARKYALNGMFAIDDTKDADTQDNSKEGTPAPAPKKPTASEGIAIALSADPEAKWFEVMAPTKNEPYAGSTLGDIVVQKDVAFLEKMKRFIEKHAAQYPLAVKRLEMAISEAGK